MVRCPAPVSVKRENTTTLRFPVINRLNVSNSQASFTIECLPDEQITSLIEKIRNQFRNHDFQMIITNDSQDSLTLDPSLDYGGTIQGKLIMFKDQNYRIILHPNSSGGRI